MDLCSYGWYLNSCNVFLWRDWVKVCKYSQSPILYQRFKQTASVSMEMTPIIFWSWLLWMQPTRSLCFVCLWVVFRGHWETYVVFLHVVGVCRTLWIPENRSHHLSEPQHRLRLLRLFRMRLVGGKSSVSTVPWSLGCIIVSSSIMKLRRNSAELGTGIWDLNPRKTNYRYLSIFLDSRINNRRNFSKHLSIC